VYICTERSITSLRGGIKDFVVALEFVIEDCLLPSSFERIPSILEKHKYTIEALRKNVSVCISYHHLVDNNKGMLYIIREVFMDPSEPICL